MLVVKADPTQGQGNTRSKWEDQNPRLCRDDVARIRYVPLFPLERCKGATLDWQTRLQETIREARIHRSRTDGWLTMFHYTNKANKALGKALDELEIEPHGRTLRHFRHGARWYFENVLQYNDRTIADILGHSVTVSTTFYRDDVTAEELANRILSDLDP